MKRKRSFIIESQEPRAKSQKPKAKKLLTDFVGLEGMAEMKMLIK
jgi:hypothetical protein